MAHTRIATGIYQNAYGYRVVYYVGGQRNEKFFPATTPISRLKQWRKRREMEKLGVKRLKAVVTPPAVPLHMDTWCYVYFVQAAEGSIKIGRTTDVRERVRRMQTFHPERLTLLAAIPAHAATEMAIHDRFKHLQREGEWFEPEDELLRFIARLRTGYNPVALLFVPGLEKLPIPPIFAEATLGWKAEEDGETADIPTNVSPAGDDPAAALSKGSQHG